MPISSSNKRTFADAIEQHCLNKTVGENGMLQFSDEGLSSTLLEVNQLVRYGDPAPQVKNILTRGVPGEIADLCVLLFNTRNARGGKGEKKLAYDIFLALWEHFPETAAQLLPLFVHYGYWKDLFLLLDLAKNLPFYQELQLAVVNIVVEQWKKDVAALNTYKADTKCTEKNHLNISLLAKWLPREGSSLDRKTNFVRHFAQFMWPAGDTSTDEEWKSASKKKYRRMVAELTSYLDLPEVLLAAQREDEINFARLASKATMRLRKVFMNEDRDGYSRSRDPKRIQLSERFLDHVLTKGLKGKQLMPHEIVNKILSRRDRISKHEEMVLDAQWKDLWKGVEEQIKAKAAEGGCKDFNPTQMIPMADVSGSMSGVPMQVSIALSIGLSEITHPAFQNLVLTFSRTPTFHKLDPNHSIVQKVLSLQRAQWDMNTNFEAAYDLIMDVAIKSNLSREDMPALVVFSDMQFDQAAYGSRLDVMHDVIKAKTAKVAKRLGWVDTEPAPIVYWNLRNTGGHPVDKDTEGTVLLSGFSPSLLRMVMSGDALAADEVEVVQMDGTVVTEKVRVTPAQILRKTLDDALYDPVRVVLAASNEGCLKKYKPPPEEQVQDEAGFTVL